MSLFRCTPLSTDKAKVWSVVVRNQLVVMSDYSSADIDSSAVKHDRVQDEAEIHRSGIT